MPQISKGDTFANGQQVTGTRLNQLVDSATLLVGAISEQTPITTNGVVANDEVAINDGGVLKKATVSDILNSGLNSTFDTINGKSGSDLILAPAAGQKVDINAAFEANSINCVGNETVGGNLSVTGTTTLTGTTTANGAVNVTGLANFTGGIQVNGSPLSLNGNLISITEETIPRTSVNLVIGAGTQGLVYTTNTYSKPTGEIWVIELELNVIQPSNGNSLFLLNNSTSTQCFLQIATAMNNSVVQFTQSSKIVINSATTFNHSFVVTHFGQAKVISPNSSDYQNTLGYSSSNATMLALAPYSGASKFRIYKYKD